MKYASGEEPMVGDKLDNGTFEYTVTAITEKGLSMTCVQGGNRYSEIIPRNSLRLVSRADASPPVAPSAAPGEVLGKDRDGRDVRKGDRVVDPHGLVMTVTDCDGREFIEAPSMRAPCGCVVLFQPTGVSDALPSPAPTGSFVVGGCEYDEIPSRYGEPDEDAVFKAKVAKEVAARRAQELSLADRHIAFSATVRKVCTEEAPGATFVTDIAPSHDRKLIAFVDIGGERLTYRAHTSDRDTTTEGVFRAFLHEAQRKLGARAMGGGK